MRDGGRLSSIFRSSPDIPGAGGPSPRLFICYRDGGPQMGKEPFSAFPHPDQEPQVMALWERFLLGRELSPNVVRDVIEGSWIRCQSAGVDPQRSQAAPPLPEEALLALQHDHRDLVGASVPIMDQVRDFLSESGTIIVLADPTGTILEAAGDPATLDAAWNIRLVTGANWNERACGTNAIGTALSIGDSVEVHAAEHFCSGIKPWTCSATVIRDPIDGAVLGVLDVSGQKNSFTRHCLSLAVIAASRIERELARREEEQRHHLVAAGLGRTSAGGLVFFDAKGRLVEVDAQAARSLRAMGVPAESGRSRRVDAFDSRLVMQTARTPLPEWLRPEWVQPILHGRERLGTIVTLPEPLRWGRTRQGASHRSSTADTARAERSSLAQIVGSSELLRQALGKAQLLAGVDVPVLLLGETGVGKERFARIIHECGRRKDGPFVTLNCGGLPRDILASELFGYVEGAFTGARRSGMVGKIEAAAGGTLFLDEIGEMPLELQPYFLRVLEGGEVYPLGDSRARKVEFRLVAATNKDLRAEVKAHRFRMDLFYRVSVTALHIPALRERTEDIPTLVEHLSREVSQRHGVAVKRFAPAALSALCAYAWPGNVRELRNVVEGLALMTTGDTVAVSDLPADVTSSLSAPPPHAGVMDLEAAERDAITGAITACHGNLTLAARELRISKSTLYVKVKKYGLDKLVPDARLSPR
jgi:sigma-54 dependent transcriptional regulator, acetoin dehydrogenase operon transcriptional activator AcoR